MKKKLLLNTISSIFFQITTLICGFILPRLILGQYGSNVNGLVSSITQFLNLIALLELGVGAVIQSSLYKPLAEKDYSKASEILVSGDRFFKKVALILVCYVVILTVGYPFFAKGDFDWLFTSLLILAMSISSFAQYYFGVVDRLLLSADQRGYIQYTAQIITLILNTIACAVLIKLGASIQIVKLTTSILFLARPIALRIYVNRHYPINRHIKFEKEPIQQKWNGIAQHFAAVVLNDTDTVVLTALSTFANVSIYSVYSMVALGVKNLILSLTHGVQAAMGELIAKQDKKRLLDFFGKTEFILHTITIYVFSCAAILIVPFVRVYTKGITDVDYIQPLFAVLLTAAHAGHCLRLPYNIVILAGEHYKQTQSNYIIAAILNIVISVVTVYFFGLVGVAIGTLVAMVYQTVWMAIYDSKNIINWPIKNFIKQCVIDLLVVGGIVGSTFWIKLQEVSYVSWIVMACEVAGIALVVTVAINFLFCKRQMLDLIKGMFGKLHRQKG